MAFQSQTYSNGNNAYYITNQAPVIPTDPTAIQTPLELLGTGGSSAAYYSRILQSDATGLSIIEASTIQGPILGITLNPKGTNGPVANAGPQIYAGTSSIFPSILITSSLTEVFGTLAVGTKLDQTDVNALKIDYSNTPAPNTSIKQTGTGTNTIELDLFSNITSSNPLINNKPGAIFRNPTDTTFPGNSAVITNSAVLIQQPTVLTPQASLSFVGGQAAVKATTVNKSITMIANSAGDGNIQTDNNLYLTTNLTGGAGPQNVLVGNTDGTTNIPLKMYGPLASTITSESRVATTSTLITNTAGTSFLSVSDSGISDYSRNAPFNTGKITWNTLGTTKGAPATASNSLEINNTASTSTIGGIQFYCGFNQDIPNPKWMGGFQYADPVKEFRLASTVQASMSQITNVSTINSIPIRDFGVPTGSMFAWCPFVPVPPAGYLICDGGQYNYTDPRYASLYAVIGQTYASGLVIAPNFRVPNMLGRAAYGSMSANDNVPPGNERTNVGVVSVITININTDNNGNSSTTVQGLYCNFTDGPLYKGMKSEGSTEMNILTILYDQTDPLKFVLIPDPAFNVILTSNNTQFYFDNQATAANGPYIGNNSFVYQTPGRGVSYYGMKTDEVPVHNHGVVATGSQNVCSSASGRSEPTFSTPINTGIYSYVLPGTSTRVSASSGIRHIPPNTSTWWIIKL